MKYRFRYFGFAAVLSFLGFVAQAAAVDVSVTEGSGSGGSQVTVSIEIDDADGVGLTAGEVKVTYDASKLTLDSAVVTDLGGSFGVNDDVVNTSDAGTVLFGFITFTPPAGATSGSWLDLTFTIGAEAAEGEIALEVSGRDFSDRGFGLIEVGTANGKITVVGIVPPTVDSIDPASGYAGGGTAVTIAGGNLQEGATVTIGGAEATDVVVAGDGTSITATTPAGAVGAADVAVNNADGGSASLSGGFTYTGVSVSGIDPAEGSVSGGQSVTISGGNFQDGASVTIGGAAATDVSVADGNTITATTPAGAAGAADVVVSNADGNSATMSGGFTYLAVIEPILRSTSPTDAHLDYSMTGTGSTADGSDGEVEFSVRFSDGAGASGAGQEITWTITNNGSESIFLVAPAQLEIVASSEEIVASTTDANGSAAATFDSEGERGVGTTSATVVASTSAANSDGAIRDRSVTFTAQWDVPVAAELSSFTAELTVFDEVLLQWAVVSQSNNLGWEIFRSADRIHFEQVGDLVLGDGTVDGFKIFRFTDEAPPQADALYYFLKQVDLDGTSARTDIIEIVLAPEVVQLPTINSLWQNFPNPFNPRTTISFDLQEQAAVTLTVYDITGQIIRTLVESRVMSPGHHKNVWDGLDNSGAKVGNGVYFYQLQAGDFSLMKKMTLLE